MARTKRRGKVARKSRVQTRRNNAMKPRVQTRRNNAMKPRVQTRRNNAVKKSVRRKRPRRSRGKQLGGMEGEDQCSLIEEEADAGISETIPELQATFIKAIQNLPSSSTSIKQQITNCFFDKIPLEDPTIIINFFNELNDGKKNVSFDTFYNTNVLSKDNGNKITFKVNFRDADAAELFPTGFRYKYLKFEYDGTNTLHPRLGVK